MADTQKRRVLITGATGLLGRAMTKAFAGWDVVGVGMTRAHGNVLRCDLRDLDAVTVLVERVQPHVIVHCAAERRTDRVQADPQGSRHLNVAVTQRLAQLSKRLQCWLLFISTDYVFDGTAPPYTSGAATNPLNEYGVQKRDAELAASEADWGCGVLRVPLLYGDVETLDESGVSAVVEQLLSKVPASLDNEQIRHPTLVDDVAQVAVRLSEQKMEHCGLSGIWHCSADEPMTKYGMAQTLARVLSLDASHISVAASNASASLRRPHNARLDASTLTLMGISRYTPFAEGAARCYQKWAAK